MATYDLKLIAAGFGAAAAIKTTAGAYEFDVDPTAATAAFQLKLDAIAAAITGLPTLTTTNTTFNATKDQMTIAGFGTIDITADSLTGIKFIADASLPAGTTISLNSGAPGTNAWSTLDGTATINGIILSGNMAALTATAAAITGGSGNDTITGGLAANDQLTGNAGADVFIAGVGAVADSITDYKFEQSDVMQAAFSAAPTITLATGKITVTGAVGDTLTTQTITTTDKVYKALVKNTAAVVAGTTDYYKTNTLTETWFADAAGAVMDASKVANEVVLTGATGADTISGNDKNNLLIGGGGADAIWGGKGNDSITLDAGADALADTIWFGATDGADVVSGFSEGFATANDVIKVWSSKNVLDNVTVASAGATSTLAVGTSDVLTINTVAAGNTTGGLKLKLQNADNTITKAWFATGAANTSLVVNSATNSVADVYIGTAANTTEEVTYAAESAGVFAWLGDSSKFKSIEKLVGGNGDDTLCGGDAVNTLTGGNGHDQLWGGSSANDGLTGGAGNDIYWFGAGDGQDNVTDYNTTGTDSVKLYDRNYDKIISGITVTKDAATFATKIAIGTDSITLNGVTGTQTVSVLDKNNKSVKLAVTDTASIDYATGTKLYYGASGKDTTLKVGAGVTSAEIYLGNGYTGIVTNDIYFADVANIDATLSTGVNTLCGNTASNVIKAGTGNTAMWGGGDKADTMVGNSGVDSFWFGTGDGKDIVQGASNLDKVVLYTDKIADLTGAVSGNDLVISTKGGDTLTITNWNVTAAASQMNTFQIGTGSTATNYKFDTTTKTFVAK